MVAMQKLAGKVAVVTGHRRGSGQPSPSAWPTKAHRWSSITPPARRPPTASWPRSLRKGGKAVAVQANMANKADIQRLFAETQRAFGRLDMLVNNAGVYEFAPMEEVTAEHFHRMFDLNVLGLLFASQEAVKHFGSDGGSIINISSVAATLAAPGDFGVQRDQGRRERRDPVAGPGTGTAQDPRQRDQPGHGRNGRRRRPPASAAMQRIPQQVESHTPLGRIGQPQDIAPAAVYLASADSAWLTGETLYISGGLR